MGLVSSGAYKWARVWQDAVPSNMLSLLRSAVTWTPGYKMESRPLQIGPSGPNPLLTGFSVLQSWKAKSCVSSCPCMGWECELSLPSQTLYYLYIAAWQSPPKLSSSIQQTFIFPLNSGVSSAGGSGSGPPSRLQPAASRRGCLHHSWGCWQEASAPHPACGFTKMGHLGSPKQKAWERKGKNILRVKSQSLPNSIICVTGISDASCCAHRGYTRVWTTGGMSPWKPSWRLPTTHAHASTDAHASTHMHVHASTHMHTHARTCAWDEPFLVWQFWW